ncbi:MAG: alpha-D-ribose 1-methylphosphonate 5-triphosphate diphosphatase [Gemmobacter sp.]
MSSILSPMRLVGAQVLRDGALQNRSVAIAGGRITRGPLPEVNLSGYLVLPGIVDLHGDAFERHLLPRPGADFDRTRGLLSAAREAAANGVTTAWCAQGWSWEGAHRGPDAAEAMLAAHAALRPGFINDIRIQLRVETHLVDEADRLVEAVRRWQIDYVIFNDHLGEGVQMLETRPGDFAVWARGLRRPAEELAGALRAAASRAAEVPRHLCRLAEAFDALGVAYGSHDDPDGETRERFSMIGARIAEFPTSRGAAAAAKAMGAPVLMGAPNVVRGRSASGNVAARALVAEGLCDALVSDYYYPALPQAAFALGDQGLTDLPRAWAMISSKPAEILGLHDRGRIEPGLRADLVIVNAASREIEATIAGGCVAYLAGEAAHRFLSGPQPALRLAAE